MPRPSDFPNIVLIGFMGAGKSTVGRHLARLAGLRLVDLDAEIVRRRGRSIPDIFAGEGEAAFREYEGEALRSLEGRRGRVVATGGGVVCRAENWEAMRRLGHVVYLEASWDVLRQRLAGSRGRPLADPGAAPEDVRKRLERRLPLYAQADLIVATDAAEPVEVAREILRLLDAGGSNC